MTKKILITKSLKCLSETSNRLFLDHKKTIINWFQLFTFLSNLFFLNYFFRCSLIHSLPMLDDCRDIGNVDLEPFYDNCMEDACAGEKISHSIIFSIVAYVSGLRKVCFIRK